MRSTPGEFQSVDDCYSLRISKNKETSKFTRQVTPYGKSKTRETVSEDGLSIVTSSDYEDGSEVSHLKIEFIDDMTVKYTLHSTEVSKSDPSLEPVQSKLVSIQKLVNGELVTQSIVRDGRSLSVSQLRVNIDLDKEGTKLVSFSQNPVKQYEESREEELARYMYCSVTSKKKIK